MCTPRHSLRNRAEEIGGGISNPVFRIVPRKLRCKLHNSTAVQPPLNYPGNGINTHRSRTQSNGKIQFGQPTKGFYQLHDASFSLLYDRPRAIFKDWTPSDRTKQLVKTE
jgi:hypothetical protein